MARLYVANNAMAVVQRLATVDESQLIVATNDMRSQFHASRSRLVEHSFAPVAEIGTFDGMRPAAALGAVFAHRGKACVLLGREKSWSPSRKGEGS